MFHRTNHDMLGTNNHIEGWHQRFKSLIVLYDPALWAFTQLMLESSGSVYFPIFMLEKYDLIFLPEVDQTHKK